MTAIFSLRVTGDGFDPGLRGVIGDIALEPGNGHGFIELASAALCRAELRADAAAHAGERVGALHEPVGIIKPVCPHKGYIAGYIHFNGAGVLAGRLKQSRAHAGRAFLVVNMGLVLMPEIA